MVFSPVLLLLLSVPKSGDATCCMRFPLPPLDACLSSSLSLAVELATARNVIAASPVLRQRNLLWFFVDVSIFEFLIVSTTPSSRA
ncbi:hypothetical protein JOM56_000868 [Amanita muscaria]